MGVLNSKVTLAVQTDAAEIVHFIMTDYPAAKPYSFGDLEPRVRWFINMGFCTIAREEVIGSSGHIQALLMGRPIIVSEMAAKNGFAYDPNGNIFYIDLICTRHKVLISYLSEMMKLSVGMKDYLAFTKDKGNMNKVHVIKTQRAINFYAPMSSVSSSI